MPDETKIGRPEAPQTLAALNLMRALRAQGYGYRLIAKKLNAAGVATAHGGPWLPGTVRAVMLRHDAKPE